MAFKFRREGSEIVVFVSGALTFHQHAEGEQLVYQVTTLVDKGEVDMVRLNFAEVTRMDSHWLGVLIRVLRRTREKNAKFVIEKPGININRLFEMVELNRIAEIRV
jgi:anti-anti-sigma factor